VFDRAFLRAAAILVAWLVIPMGVLTGLARAGVQAAMYPLLPLLFIIYPHNWIVHRTTDRSTAVFSSTTAAIVAIIQWAAVAIAFSVLTRRYSPLQQAWLAPLVVVGVGIVVLILVHLLGLEVEADCL